MRWSLLDAAHLDPLIRFVGPREAGCVGFTRRLVHQGRVIVPPRRHYHVLVRLEGIRVTGAILQDTGGLYYPILDPSQPVVEPEAVRLLERGTKRLYSVMGLSGDVIALESAFGRAPEQFVEYHLMVQGQQVPDVRPARLPAGLEVEAAGIGESDRLFGLQKMYEIEEVLLPGSTFRADACRHHLEETLRTQITLYARIGERAIAKVGTNARGLFYDQIGGVFTDPDYRNRGIGTLLMARLLRAVAADQKSGTLFVKKENGAALRMYENLGFVPEDEFRISYYR